MSNMVRRDKGKQNSPWKEEKMPDNSGPSYKNVVQLVASKLHSQKL